MSEYSDYALCLGRQNRIKERFEKLSTLEERYDLLIELGRTSARLASEHKVAPNLVQGCQSVMYLRSWIDEAKKVHFAADSEALISAGLAQLLIEVYSGLEAETILTCPPTYLEDLNISASVSPSRVNGLYSVHLRMKRDALKALAGG